MGLPKGSSLLHTFLVLTRLITEGILVHIQKTREREHNAFHQ